ncbi:hypothetical protein EVJ58_g5653 [Rhodofomes roseus]|uniref:cAMP-dependent protein kinase n=1 Tax=Rhodofomes roseus TaxID=34475 RepID=A0A4Y9YFI1_9APHY|nr:hypothetical protein EVJ58_g5653 [Rhodofomes roseus]
MGMICGIVCVFASMVGSAVAVLLRTHLKEYRDPANGKWWLSSTVTESRWTSVPFLFAVPDAWFIWASIAFNVFFVAFCWERLVQGSSGNVRTAADMRFYIAAAAMLSALATSGVAHVLMVLWVSSPKPHTNLLATGGTASATPASPSSSYASTANTFSTNAYPYAQDYGTYQRESISTEYTSLSGYGNNSNIPKPVPGSASFPAASGGGGVPAQRDWSNREESMYVEDSIPAKFLPLRPKGSYRLSDFIMQRTLGTGSFGRVHLAQLTPQQRFPDPVAKFYAAEVALALNYLHSLDIIYRDLKPENILLNFDGHIKIADFGFARWCETTVWTLCGTPDYLAPEIIGNARYNKSVDWYALGVLTFEMLSGLPPFHEPDISPVKLYEKITVGPTCIKWPDFHPNAKDIILKLMAADPSKRYGNLRHGAGDVFAHRWFSEVDWDKLRNREIQAPYLPRINGDGDASAFERYPEIDASIHYGGFGPDPYGDQFPDFEYAAL